MVPLLSKIESKNRTQIPTCTVRLPIRVVIYQRKKLDPVLYNFVTVLGACSVGQRSPTWQRYSSTSVHTQGGGDAVCRTGSTSRYAIAEVLSTGGLLFSKILTFGQIQSLRTYGTVNAIKKIFCCIRAGTTSTVYRSTSLAERGNRDERRIGMCFSPASANNNINYALSLSLSMGVSSLSRERQSFPLSLSRERGALELSYVEIEGTLYCASEDLLLTAYQRLKHTTLSMLERDSSLTLPADG